MKTCASKPFYLSGYSFGGCVAQEMILQLQDNRAPIKPLILLDGSNKFVTTHTGIYRDLMNIHDDNQAEAVALSSFAEKFGLDSKVGLHLFCFLIFKGYGYTL